MPNGAAFEKTGRLAHATSVEQKHSPNQTGFLICYEVILPYAFDNINTKHINMPIESINTDS